MANICNYTYDPNILTSRKINNELTMIHSSLCYLQSYASSSGACLSCNNTFTGTNVFTKPITGGTNYPTNTSTLDLGSSSGFPSASFNFGSGQSILFGSLANFAFIQSIGFTQGLYFNAFGTGNIQFDAPAGELIWSKNNAQYVAIGTANAIMLLKAGTTALAPIIFSSGSLLTSATAGAMEWDGTNLYITASTTRKTILSEIGVTSSSTNTVTNKIQINIGGTTYYLLASTSAT